MASIALIGYSGHAYVVIDSLERLGTQISGYFELQEKEHDPFHLPFLGKDSPELLAKHRDKSMFVAIGDNRTRQKSIDLVAQHGILTTITDPQANISNRATVHTAAYIARGASVGPLATIGEGAIVNTHAVVEHECHVGRFAHIAPGAVLTGNVSVDEGAFIGANSVVRPGVNIGAWATIGAGAVVVSDIAAHTVVAGNPARLIST